MKFSIDRNYHYGSRRSVVMAKNAAVASSQPLATEAGVRVLRLGGSAADAAVAVAAALQVTQPCSTGLGGDAFFLYFEASTRTVHAYNGSGRCPAALDLAAAKAVEEAGRLPKYHPHTVTVPGAADAWAALHQRFGTLPFAAALEGATELAREGFPVAPMASRWWTRGAEVQLAYHEHGGELMIDRRGPRPGELFDNPGLATVLETLVSGGPDEFYNGWVAERIVRAVQSEGGVLSADDLSSHRGEWVDPISVAYRNHRVWECPPNGQGLVALLALQTLAELTPRTPAERLHAQVEAIRLAFADAAIHIGDPHHADIPLAGLLSPVYARTQAASISLDSRITISDDGMGSGSQGTDTVYFCTVDELGNGCSFINSNYMGFGTGIVPEGCGFGLQNRGHGFVLHDGHVNSLAPGKRPFHTIIPGLITHEDTSELGAVFGVMGGPMQPQGHLQVVSALVDDHLDPQSALDAPRFCIENGEANNRVLLEDVMEGDLVDGLTARGHEVSLVSGVDRAAFGLGQVIANVDGVWWCGSDPRGDGCAIGV